MEMGRPRRQKRVDRDGEEHEVVECWPDWMPSARIVSRRRPVRHEFDQDCGYAYDHEPVFVEYTKDGNRRYECANCGTMLYYDEFTVDADIHEMVEVGKFELLFAPQPTKPYHMSEQQWVQHKMETRSFHAEARRRSAEIQERRRRRKAEEEEDDVRTLH